MKMNLETKLVSYHYQASLKQYWNSKWLLIASSLREMGQVRRCSTSSTVGSENSSQKGDLFSEAENSLKNQKKHPYDPNLQLTNPVKWKQLKKRRKREGSYDGNVSKNRPFNTPEIQEEIVFGLHPVRLALDQNRRTCHRLLVKAPSLTESSINEGNDENSMREEKRSEMVKRILKLARVKHVPISMVSPRELDRMSSYRPHQGVCLDASPRSYDEWDFEWFKPAENFAYFWLFLDRILDPMNFGAILRSAYFLGAEAIFVANNSRPKLSPLISKASSGILEVQKIFTVESSTEFLKECKNRDFDLMASSSEILPDKKHISAFDLSLEKSTVLLLGNEGSGIDEELLSLCDRTVFIPPMRKLQEGTESLNVSVASGILLFAAARAKLKIGKKKIIKLSTEHVIS